MGWSLELDLVPLLASLAHAEHCTALEVDALQRVALAVQRVALAGPILWGALPSTAVDSAAGFGRLLDYSAVSHDPLVVLA